MFCFKIKQQVMQYLFFIIYIRKQFVHCFYKKNCYVEKYFLANEKEGKRLKKSFNNAIIEHNLTYVVLKNIYIFTIVIVFKIFFES